MRICHARPFYVQVDRICKDSRTFEYVFFIGESVPHIGQLSVSCYSGAKASDSFGKIWEYFVMPTIVNTFVKCFDNPNVDTLCPDFEASISIWMISAIPLELM